MKLSNSKPELILHPGFPKCATSTIQRLFVVDNHALGRLLYVSFIGRDFKPDNGYPEVSMLMYDVEKAHDFISTVSYPAGKYFLSNEAVFSHPETISLLAERFQIRKCIFTIRFPPFQALSSFRFSGWVNNSLEDFLLNKNVGPQGAFERLLRKVDIVRPFINGDVSLCPIERLDIPLEERFLKQVFGMVPEILSGHSFSEKVVVNESISEAFANVLGSELRTQSVAVPPKSRQRLIKIAQQYSLPEDLKKLRMPETAEKFCQTYRPMASRYISLLRESSLPEDQLEAIESRVLSDFDVLQTTAIATSREIESLRIHAQQVIRTYAGM
ncbi:MAG: hypothetical protein ABJN04_09810 [Hyphomicrobiales bacterium]